MAGKDPTVCKFAGYDPDRWPILRDGHGSGKEMHVDSDVIQIETMAFDAFVAFAFDYTQMAMYMHTYIHTHTYI